MLLICNSEAAAFRNEKLLLSSLLLNFYLACSLELDSIDLAVTCVLSFPVISDFFWIEKPYLQCYLKL